MPITSTYLAPLLAFFVPPAFLGPAAPNKSSILLELLRLVGGRDPGPGGPPPSAGALAVLVLDTERSIETGPAGGPRAPLAVPGRELDGDDDGGPMPRLAERGGPAGGALARPAAPGEEGIAACGGPGLALTERGAALGGGAVVFLTASSGPAFLLTQRLSSGS